MLQSAAVLIVWIGIGTSQNQSMTNFDSYVQCEAARVALRKVGAIHRSAECIPYTYDTTAE